MSNSGNILSDKGLTALEFLRKIQLEKLNRVYRAKIARKVGEPARRPLVSRLLTNPVTRQTSQEDVDELRELLRTDEVQIRLDREVNGGSIVSETGSPVFLGQQTRLA